MKKTLFICSIFLLSFSVQAQFDSNNGLMTSSLAQSQKAKNKNAKGAEKIKQLKSVFIAKELDLKSEEYNDFWSIYNKYEDALSQIWRDCREDRNTFETKKKQLQKEYRPSFQKALSSEQRAEKVYAAEGKFRDMLKKELKERKD